jgi:hypothetical protein
MGFANIPVYSTSTANSRAEAGTKKRDPERPFRRRPSLHCLSLHVTCCSASPNGTDGLSVATRTGLSAHVMRSVAETRSCRCDSREPAFGKPRQRPDRGARATAWSHRPSGYRAPSAGRRARPTPTTQSAGAVSFQSVATAKPGGAPQGPGEARRGS